MTNSADAVRRHLQKLARNADSAAELVGDAAARYAELVRETLVAGGKLMYAGNGGSAAAAGHIATEYVVRLQRDRRALPAIALTASTSTLSAAANDFGYERVFARLVEAHGRAGDLLVTSGLGGAFPAGYPVAVVETVNRIPQEPFADVTARPAASLDQVREVMLIWSAPTDEPQ